MLSLANVLKSSLVAVLVVAGALGSSAPANPAKPIASNCVSGICTSVILGYNEDVCVISSFNEYAVIAYVAVSPWPYGSVGTLWPIVLGVLGERRVFAWTPGRHDRHTYQCFVISVK